MDGPGARERQEEHRADSSGLHHRTERLSEVNTRPLGKATKNPACLVPLKGAIELKLVLENPLASDDVGLRRSRHEVPSVILQESTVFFFHSRSPIGVSESATKGLGHCREGGGVVGGRHPIASLRPRAHSVLVRHWNDSNGALG